MPITVSKWGNSLAVRLPSNVVHQAKLAVGDAVEVTVSRGGRVMIDSVRKERDFRALYKLITPENRHEEVATGAPRGFEIVEW
jgi:antitoxin MazE